MGRFFLKLHGPEPFRGILIRWSKKAENYIALLHMSFAFIIYRRMGLSG